MSHAEVALDPAIDVRSFVVTNEDDIVVPDPGEPASHGRVVAEEPVAGELVEIVGQGVAVSPEVRTLGLASRLSSAMRSSKSLIGRSKSRITVGTPTAVRGLPSS